MSMRSPWLVVLALPMLVNAAGAATLEALVRTPAGQPLADAAVVLEPLAPAPAAKSHPNAVIEQRGTEFAPYVTVVQTGTAVDFPNKDTVRHHVYSFSQPKRFEIKLYAGKPGQPITFDKPGEVVIGCNIHDWMEAYVLVVETPYFGKTGPDGQVRIANLPAGRYRLQLWHPLQKARAAASEIELGANGAGAAKLNLVLDARKREPRPHTEVDQDRY
ncbi:MULTISPECIES: methylamine utilization protein [unclassified Massilia]|uniref:methylamine utilization protein n=1 Tax=unclassified Massilia TaxID=2609279 RepID=UPI000A47DED4|nr:MULTISPECIES: methylamine utilization protein [unclassified Massilia]